VQSHGPPGPFLLAPFPEGWQVHLSEFMKSLLVLAGTLFCIAVAALADVPGSVGNVNFALKLSYLQEGLPKKGHRGRLLTGMDAGSTYRNGWSFFTERNGVFLTESGIEEYGAKTGVSRYGNRQFLMDLLETGILPEPEKGIGGWALVRVTATFDVDAQRSRTGKDWFYAVHAKRNLVVLLTGSVIMEDVDYYEERFGYVEDEYREFSLMYRYATDKHTTNLEQVGTSRSVRRYQLNIRGQVLDPERREETAQFQCLQIQALNLIQINTGNPRNPLARVVKFGTARFDKLTGTGAYVAENHPYYEGLREIIEGSISVAGGRVFPDISERYPEATQY